MNTENMIEITGADLVEVVKAAYDLSLPQGLGHLHYDPAPLTDEEAKSLVDEDYHIPVSLDYIKGRACKFTVFKKVEKLFIRDSWYDHTDEDLLELLKRIGKV